MSKVYNYNTREIAFEGTPEECRKWIVSQGFHMPDGRIIYRTWKEGRSTIYDVGKVYALDEK